MGPPASRNLVIVTDTQQYGLAIYFVALDLVTYEPHDGNQDKSLPTSGNVGYIQWRIEDWWWEGLYQSHGRVADANWF